MKQVAGQGHPNLEENTILRIFHGEKRHETAISAKPLGLQYV